MAIVKNANHAGNQGQPEGGDTRLPGADRPAENLDRAQWGKFLITSVTGLGVLIYGIGYCCHVGHHKMLGVSRIECAHESVILDGVQFFILAPLCVLGALCTLWLTWVILLLSVAVFLLGRFARSVSRRGSGPWGSAVIPSRIANVGFMALLHALFFFLASVIGSQVDLLLASKNQVGRAGTAAVVFRTLTSQSSQLPELLAEPRCARSVYGVLFLIATIICLRWVGWLLKPGCGSRMAREHRGWLKTMVKRVGSGIGLYVILLLVVLVFYLYGFLVKSNRYPVIRSEGAAAGLLPAENLSVLGDSGSCTLLYSVDPGEAKIWWVEKSAYVPASRSEPARDLFERADPDCACHETPLYDPSVRGSLRE